MRHSTLLLCLLLTACVDQEYDPDSDDTGGDGKADGLGDFTVVHIDYTNTVPFYACAAGTLDTRCDNTQTTFEKFSFPGTFDGLASVTHVGDKNDAILISTRDWRLLSPASRPITINNLTIAPLPDLVTSSGFRLDYKLDGETKWRPALTSSIPQWVDVTFDAAKGTATGTRWICQGWTCEKKTSTFRTSPILNGLVEYRVTIVPIWNLGTFDTGTFPIKFTVN